MEQDMAALEKKRIYWERNKTEAQGNLGELVRQIQQAQAP
jgi:prefoldin subunit 1